MGKKKGYNNEKHVNHALRKLCALFDGMDEPIYISDPDTYEILFANKKLKELAGEEIVGNKCYKVFHNLKHPCPFCTNKYIFGENLGKTYIWEQQNRRNKRWYKCIDKAIEWPGDKHVRFAIAIDITEHKQAEEAVKSGEQEKDTILNNLVEHVIHEDKTMKILWANQAACESAGMTREELIGRHCYEVWQKRSTPCPDCAVIKAMGTGQPQKVEKTTPDGRSWFIRGYPVLDANGKVVGGIEVTLEITKRKQAEEALRESEELFHSVVENSHDGILIIDDNFRITYANDEIARIGGRPKGELIGQDFRKFLGKEEKSQAEALYLRRQKKEKVPSRYELKITRKNGEKRNIEVKSTTIQDSMGRVHTVVQIIDITERKKSEERIRESEEKYRKQFEEAMDAIFIADAETGMIIDCNRAASELVSREKSELVGEHQRILHPPEKHKGKFSSSFKQHLGEKEGQVLETQVLTKKGEIKEVAIKANLFEFEGKKLIQGIFRDITERKKMEKERKHVEERLSALNKYGQSLNMATSLAEIYRVMLKAMEKTLGFEYASILLVQGKTLQLVSHRGYSKQLSLSLPLDGEKGITARAARTGKPILVSDIRKEKTYILGKPNMLSELAVPIRVEKEVIGVLNVESKKLAAFDEEDRRLLEILASHAGIAITDIKRHEQLRKLSKRLANLMKSSTEIMHVEDMHQRLKVIAEAIKKFGWRRVVISLRDENLEGTDLVTSGLTKEEFKLLLERKAPGDVWRERLGPKFERFKIGEFYYLPWRDPWIREYVHRIPPEAPLDEATTYAGVPSRLSLEEMVDWHPQDMLYAPLHTPEGRIVGVLSMDDPMDGRKPARESLAPLELFLYQAAMVIENVQLIESLREARKQLEAYAEQLEEKVEERTRELKKSQQQLLKAQRLAVIGELAGMVGHDLRNPLTSINGAAYYLKKRLSSKIDSKVREMLDLIEKNIVYSNKIINDLLDYSREIKLDVTVSNAKSIIKDALSLVEVPENVRILDLTENKPKIKVDVGKIKRAFVNMIKNAIEAMPKGGRLTIKSKKLNGNSDFVFSDTGVGMSKKTMQRLWTPLFTTKAKGMGFGLAICKRIVEAHGGSISVKSTRGKGTTFTVTIPTRVKIEGGEKIWVKPLESSLLTTTKT